VAYAITDLVMAADPKSKFELVRTVMRHNGRDERDGDALTQQMSRRDNFLKALDDFIEHSPDYPVEIMD
jgi:hypothetical protein